MAGAVGDCVAVVHAGERRDLKPGDVYTFGRATDCTACLDPDDLGISRLAGSVERESGTWWVLNRSTVRALTVVDELGIRTLVSPGRRLAVAGSLTVVVEGAARRHALDVIAELAPAFGASVAQPGDSRPTATTDEVMITHQDRQALVAVFAGYLYPFPRYDPHPRSYAAAATELGWPRTTLVKRIEYIRIRLNNAGVPGLLGDSALQHLAEWALTTRVITRDDLAVLRPTESGAGDDG